MLHAYKRDSVRKPEPLAKRVVRPLVTFEVPAF
jgi:hypothetical protein